MIFSDRVIVLLFVGAVILAVGLVGPMIRLADAELGRVALLAGALMDLIVIILVIIDRRSLGRADRADREIVVERTTEDIVSQGVTNIARIAVENRTAGPVVIDIADTLPETFEAEDAMPLRATVPPQTRIEMTYRFRPMARGRASLGDLHIRRWGRLKLVARQERRPAARPVAIFPDIYGVARSRMLMARAGRRAQALRRTRVLGEGREFHRLRPYVQGDDIRLIDWKATAKRRQPTTREFELERNQRLMIVLDAGRMMTGECGSLNRLDYAVAAAMGLANVALLSGDRVGLLVFSKEVRGYLPARKGAGQFRRIVDMLAGLEADLFESDYAYALGYLAARMSRRSLVVMLTDMGSGGASQSMIARLSALRPRHLPVCATIADRELAGAAQADPREAFDAFRSAAAREVLHEQTLTRQVLSSRGVVTVHVDAEELLPGIINRYIDIKSRGRL